MISLSLLSDKFQNPPGPPSDFTLVYVACPTFSARDALFFFTFLLEGFVLCV